MQTKGKLHIHVAGFCNMQRMSRFDIRAILCVSINFARNVHGIAPAKLCCMIRFTAAISGVALICVGFLGFALSNPLGLHLALANDFLLIFAGVLGLFSGTIGSALAARSYCSLFGTLFGILGVAGLFGTEPNRLLTVIPHYLVFGNRDHVAHLILSGFLLLAGLYGKYQDMVFRHGGSGFQLVWERLPFLDAHGHSSPRHF